MSCINRFALNCPQIILVVVVMVQEIAHVNRKLHFPHKSEIVKLGLSFYSSVGFVLLFIKLFLRQKIVQVVKNCLMSWIINME